MTWSFHANMFQALLQNTCFLHQAPHSHTLKAQTDPPDSRTHSVAAQLFIPLLRSGRRVACSSQSTPRTCGHGSANSLHIFFRTSAAPQDTLLVTKMMAFYMYQSVERCCVRLFRLRSVGCRACSLIAGSAPGRALWYENQTPKFAAPNHREITMCSHTSHRIRIVTCAD